MEDLAEMQAYLADRPELIDVAKEPKLVFDGVAHPTGTQQT